MITNEEDEGFQVAIPCTKIKKLEGSFMVLDNAEESNIPSRIKKVTKNNVVVWERK